MTSDSQILHQISGVTLEFDQIPEQRFIPKPYKFDPDKFRRIDDKIKSMLSKAIIEPTWHEPGQFISNIFTRDKKDGDIRVILDLSELNDDITYHHFKMETFQAALDLVFPNCFMASIDWKDAYFSVPVRKGDRKYLKFIWGGKLFQFTALPNGLSSAPRIFTKITKVMLAELRKRGHLITSFIDDSFLVGDESGCEDNVMETVNYSEESGWVVHPVKSRFKPAQQRIFLGFIINSVLMIVTLTEERIQKMSTVVERLLNQRGRVTIRRLAEAIGLMVASFPAVELGQLYYRTLDNFKTLCLKLSSGNFEAKFEIPQVCRGDLAWWKSNIATTSAPITRRPPDVVLTSDASHIGWGGTCQNRETGGNWGLEERTRHINQLELMAALFTIKAFCTDAFDQHILIKSDNTTTVVYINHMGGRKKECNAIARELWMWCTERKLFVTATYLPGALNVRADAQSRTYHHNGEWSLDFMVFSCIAEIWGMPQIDLFASRLNYKVKPYYSWQPDPDCEAQGTTHQPPESGKSKQTAGNETGGSLGRGSGETDEELDHIAKDVLSAAWRDGTKKQYKGYLLKWFTFCNERNCDPMVPDVNLALRFLTSLYKKGLGYSAINTARCALSGIITVDGKPFGTIYVVNKFMRGLFNLRPALPKAVVTWDVSVVLAHLRSLSPVTELSLKQLSIKVVMLMALLTGARCQTLHLIDIRNISLSETVLKIRFGDLLKQTRPGFQQEELVINAYAPDRRLCLCAALLEYLKRTEFLRGEHKSLFISSIKPHGPVAKDTISRWVKEVMKEAGVDTDIFSPHSVRGAATSKAKLAKVAIATILKTAGWSGEGTFAKFYDKKIVHEGQFGEAIYKQ
ncbi:uncharacterized protein LOC135492550 [Lineus longissimus]|uniref:uncharacterized protein LOC135492550 n=1 Tax=Lineus longissimus TaxID=88925 RepID=UPI00315DA374